MPILQLFFGLRLAIAPESRDGWYYKLSRSEGKRSRSQHDVKYQQHKRVSSQEGTGWLTSNLVKITQVRSTTCDMFKVTRSDRSEIKPWQIYTVKKNTWKRRLNAKLLLPFRKSLSLNLMAISAIAVSAHAQYKFGWKQRRTTGATSGGHKYSKIHRSCKLSFFFFFLLLLFSHKVSFSTLLLISSSNFHIISHLTTTTLKT